MVFDPPRGTATQRVKLNGLDNILYIVVTVMVKGTYMVTNFILGTTFIGGLISPLRSSPSLALGTLVIKMRIISMPLSDLTVRLFDNLNQTRCNNH